MRLIWFNPDLECYETGLAVDFKNSLNFSKNHDRFEVLHEFDLTKSGQLLAEKIAKRLNHARIMS